ncbi:MAG: IS3 family transposase [Cytophagaceae bacterium]
MEELRSKYPEKSLSSICRLFGISRQAYYQYCKLYEEHQLQSKLIVDAVKEVRLAHKRIGTRKLYHMLQPFFVNNHLKIGRDSFFDLLRREDLLIKRRRRGIQTTMSYHKFYKWSNLVKDIIPEKPQHIVVSDITYWKVQSKHLYISLITDAYSHKIVGYNVSDTLETSESIKALELALPDLLRGQASQLIHHSDRGIQYCSSQYVKLLQDNNILISMTEDSDPRDNAIAERVNGILKNEYLADYKVNTLEEAKDALEQSVNKYNNERPHLSIEYLTPSIVHSTSIKAKRKWKSYYKKNTNDKLFQDN